MNRSILFATAVALGGLTLSPAARAQEIDKAAGGDALPVDMTITGFLNISAHYNANNPLGGVSALRSYDAKADSFTLNALHAVVSLGFGGGLAATIEVDAGSDASVNRLDPDGPEKLSFDLQEAYVTYAAPGLPFGFKAGKFATTAGIEVIESPDNPTITRGFLFGLAEPFTHVGFLATWKEGPFDAAAGAVNGWDVTADNNTGKTGLAKVTFAAEEGLGLTVSFLAGPEQKEDHRSIRRLVDATGFISPFEALRLNVQALWGDDEVRTISSRRVRWYGLGLQPVAVLAETLSVGLRAEWFRDADGARLPAGGEVEAWNLTVTPSLRVAERLTVRIEARFDRATEELFEDDQGGFKDRQATMSLDVIVRY